LFITPILLLTFLAFLGWGIFSAFQVEKDNYGEATVSRKTAS